MAEEGASGSFGGEHGLSDFWISTRYFMNVVNQKCKAGGRVKAGSSGAVVCWGITTLGLLEYH